MKNLGAGNEIQKIRVSKGVYLNGLRRHKKWGKGGYEDKKSGGWGLRVPKVKLKGGGFKLEPKGYEHQKIQGWWS